MGVKGQCLVNTAMKGMSERVRDSLFYNLSCELMSTSIMWPLHCSVAAKVGLWLWCHCGDDVAMMHPSVHITHRLKAGTYFLAENTAQLSFQRIYFFLIHCILPASTETQHLAADTVHGLGCTSLCVCVLTCRCQTYLQVKVKPTSQLVNSFFFSSSVCLTGCWISC